LVVLKNFTVPVMEDMDGPLGLVYRLRGGRVYPGALVPGLTVHEIRR